MLTKAELPECPVATTLQLIGNKWKILILRNLMVRPWRFNELQKSLDRRSETRNASVLRRPFSRKNVQDVRQKRPLPRPFDSRPHLFFARYLAGISV